ncbi:MAG: DUF2796 domain-containing protein [Gammaproteobacteria bacterium]|nr:DUF2796 domain-containing protein [Gammaproteobacteria bacterium]
MRTHSWPSLLVLLCTATLAAQAGRAADAGAGVSSLSVQFAGSDLALELRGSSEKFFGFHGLPVDDHQRQLVVSGAALLRDAGTMFRLPPTAGCRIVEVALAGAVLEASGQAGTYMPGPALERLRERDVPLGGRSGGGGGGLAPDTASVGASADDPASEGGGIHADYRYRCSRPDALDQIAVQVFTSFPATGVMSVTVSHHDDSASFEIDASSPLIELRDRRD